MSTLLRNGRVHRRSRPPASALLIDGGVITWVGDATDAPAATTVVELDGALVTAAFVDAHVHATSTGLALTGLDLRHAGSLAEALTMLERAARASRGRPVIGGGWDETRWPERRAPLAAELDRAAYGGLVYLARVDVHSAVVSSSLMASVPHLRSTEGYRPDGWQRGPAHDEVRTIALSALTAGQRRDAQRAALERAASLGIASVHEMAGPVISSEDDLMGLLQLAAAEPLPEVIGYWAELHGTGKARELGAVGVGGDLFCDGSLGSHTAGVHEPYADRPDTCGLLRFEAAELAEHIGSCAGAGLQAGFHAIGDAAVDLVLDAVELVSRRTGRRGGVGHRIEHAEYVRDPARLAASGLTASVQPCFDALWGGPSGMYAERLGPLRAAGLNRFADLAAAGVPLALGSDAPVTELGPWSAVRAAVHPSDPSCGLDPQTAFAAHTEGGWRAAGVRDAGQLEPGHAATFAVWRAGADVEPDVDPGAGSGAGGLPDLSPGRSLPTCLATVSRGRSIFDTGLFSGLGD